MIDRKLEKKLQQAAEKFPVIAILGPRQSGKTTLARKAFAIYGYVSLEDLDIREFARTDPRGFLETYSVGSGVIFDEIQYVPALFSYLQTWVDREKKPGFFVLTGSHNFLRNQAISQTLAGRVALLTLLPFSIGELQSADMIPEDVQELLFKGCYPRIYDESIAPIDWYPNYIRTYVERDVRQMQHVADVSVFQRLLKLCAGRIGQPLNTSSLADDTGIDARTARSWLSLLEASYIIFLLQPHHNNFSKRLIKSPKLYFYDTGLAASLLGIERADQLTTHYLRGGLFESLILSDFMKQRLHAGLRPNIYFWRDKAGHEVDCIIEQADTLIPVEIKAGKTVVSSYFDGVRYWSECAQQDPKKSVVIYAGDGDQKRSDGRVLGWRSVSKV